MKNKHIIVILLVHLLLVRGFANAQSPNAIPYQGLARNSSGNILASQPISLRISIHDVIPTGTVVYSETHAVITTSLGLFSINIGQGAIITGTLAGVNWGTGAKFMQVEFDPAPPSSYIDMGTTQLNSVPYALYAGTFKSGTLAGQMLYWDGSAWVAIPSGVVGQVLTYGSNGPVWQSTGTVKITTAPVSNIVGGAPTCGGNIISSSTPVTARGVCWSTSPNPTIANNFTTDGTGLGSFVSNFTGLTIFTTYYVRAYATNSGAGTSYGNEISFTTLNTTFPTLTTSPITNISSVMTGGTAISGGNITDDGGQPVFSRGVCWSTSPNPTTANSKTIDGSGIGTFVSNITGLTGNTTYYVRAYATSSVGTAYGNEIGFTTLPGLGQPYFGGLMAYCLQPTDPGFDANVPHGLIVSASDQNGPWGCFGQIFQNTSAMIGTGNANTINIMASCSEPGIAARLCGDLVSGGYSDWYLPSAFELFKIYDAKWAIWPNGYWTAYWSSTESWTQGANAVDWQTGQLVVQDKRIHNGVRAVRSF